MNGGRCSSYTDEENQALTERCGILGPIEAQKEFSGHPAPDFFERYARWIMPEPNSGCWLWLGTALPKARPAVISGYGWFRRKGQFFYAHRSALEAKLGAPLGSLVARHSCDNPICVNPDHLEAGTKRDNGQDMVRRGRSLRGERNINSVLKEREAVTVIRLATAGVEQGRIAAHFGIDQSMVSYLKTGKRWPHLANERKTMPRPKQPGMLIDDTEIVSLVGQERAIEVLADLDSGRSTQAYQPFWGGRRYRMKVLERLQELGV